ncbi:MAG TPA: hypothetical protein VM618_10900 [Acidimicrobiia bacterium]|nr:hypothetical protein [Acidimicrobiia bacterium]
MRRLLCAAALVVPAAFLIPHATAQEAGVCATVQISIGDTPVQVDENVCLPPDDAPELPAPDLPAPELPAPPALPAPGLPGLPA